MTNKELLLDKNLPVYTYIISIIVALQNRNSVLGVPKLLTDKGTATVTVYYAF